MVNWFWVLELQTIPIPVLSPASHVTHRAHPTDSALLRMTYHFAVLPELAQHHWTINSGRSVGFMGEGRCRFGEREPGTLREAFIVGMYNSTHTHTHAHACAGMHALTYICTHSCAHALTPMHLHTCTVCMYYTDPHTPTQAHMITHIASFVFACLILVCWQLSLLPLSNVPFSAAALPSAGEMDVIASSATACPIQKSLAVSFFLLCFLYHLYCSTSVIKWAPTGQNQGTAIIP